MRQGSNGRRPRGRPQRKQHGGTPRHGNFDSSGPEGRIRGNAHQVYEKYIGLARDALSMGDRIEAETYYQYAEHYYRIVNVRADPKPNGDSQGQGQGQGQSGRRGGNGHAEAAPRVADEQPDSAPFNGEQPQEGPQAQAAPPAQAAPQAQDRPAGQGRRRPRQAKSPEPQAQPQPDTKPDPKPEAQPGPEAQTREDGDSAET